MAFNRQRPSLRGGKLVWILLAGAVVIGGSFALRNRFTRVEAVAQVRGATPRAAASRGEAAAVPRVASTAPRQAIKPLETMAVVNDQPITRDALARETIRRHGNEVLESLIARRLIGKHCEQRGIEITQQDVDAEIAATAKKFKLPVDQWLGLLENERGVTPQQYANEIIWPTIALRRIAGAELEVTQEEMQRLYESNYGSRVHVRIIVVRERELADKVFQMATETPDDFDKLAGKFSIDIDSASAGGRILPIRRHLGDKTLEETAFALQAGEIGGPLQLGEQWVVIKCDGHAPPRKVSKDELPTIRQALQAEIRDRKLRTAGNDWLQRMLAETEIKNVLNDPVASKQMPGVAATVGGERITLLDLGNACIERHGEAVLQGMISQMVLEQSLAARQLKVDQADVDAEVARAAIAAGVVDANGQPDLHRWMNGITEAQGLTPRQYMDDVVWPTCALKELVAGEITITAEDIQNSYEANYGERVRVRAIVMNNHRRALEVWNMARQNPTIEQFGDLAAEYSVERGSRELRGEVPPIQQHGGQPVLEKAAFEMAAGEISGVIQVGELFTILYCEGRTEPVEVEREEVEQLIRADITEKKTRLAMATRFEQLHKAARIDNYLNPSLSNRPKKKAEGAAAPK